MKQKFTVYYSKKSSSAQLDLRVTFDNVFSKTPQIFGAIHLKQIGDIYCESDHTIELHHQAVHEICCIVAGSGIFFRNNKAYSVKEGDIFLTSIDSDHMIISDRKNPLRILYCAFVFIRDHHNYHIYSDFEKLLFDDSFTIIPDKFGISNIFYSVFKEVQRNYKNKSIMMELELTQLFLMTQRCVEEKKEKDFNYTKGIDSKKQLVYEIIKYIDNHLFHIDQLTDIANALGYSYSYITQSFSSVMHENLISYYRRQRLKKAAELLSGGCTVTTVAEMLKFDSIQSFSKSFKNYFGISPSVYSKTQTS